MSGTKKACRVRVHHRIVLPVCPRVSHPNKLGIACNAAKAIKGLSICFSVLDPVDPSVADKVCCCKRCQVFFAVRGLAWLGLMVHCMRVHKAK